MRGADRFALIAAVLLVLTGVAFRQLRYAAYLVPVIALLIVALRPRMNASDATLPFLFLIAVYLLHLPIASEEGWKDLFFLISGVALFVVVRFPKVDSVHMILLLTGIFLAALIDALVHGKVLASSALFSVSESTGILEGAASFLPGLIAVYAVAKRKWVLFLLSLLVALLMLKRIVVFAVLLIALVEVLPRGLALRILAPFTAILTNAVAASLLILYSMGIFDDVVWSLFGQSSNQLGMGRQELLSPVAAQILGADPLTLLIGNGLGAAYSTIDPSSPIKNLHSDVLKLIYELGVVVPGIFLWLGYRQSQFFGRQVFLYLNVMLLTDNVLAYAYFIFFLLFVLFAGSSLQAQAKKQLGGAAV